MFIRNDIPLLSHKLIFAVLEVLLGF